jgi:imidazolonepropionase-like amidohydrolase
MRKAFFGRRPSRLLSLLALLSGAAALAIPAVHCAAAQDLPTGRFAGPRGLVLEIGNDGTWSVGVASGVVQVSGKYRVTSGQLELTDNPGPRACAAGAGRYTWRYGADTLRFSVVDDPCTGRRGAFASTWTTLREALALTHATIIDGTGAQPRAGMTIVMRGGRIAALFPDGAQPLPSDATERSAAGKFVLPGLIDAHVHNATNPSGEDSRARVEQRLRNALLGGVVAVRDMGGDGRALADLQRAANAGDIVSPDIHYSAIIAGPGFFVDPRVLASSAGYAPGTAPFARAVTDTTDMRQVIAEARGSGATAVKMYAALDGPTAKRVAAEAKRQGLHVWAHLALFPARPSDVVAAGVEVVSHVHLAIWEAAAQMPSYGQRSQIDMSVTPDNPAIRRLFAMMRERGTILDATLWVIHAPANAPDTSIAKRREKLAIELTRAAHAAGIRFAAGTDDIGADSAGALPNIHHEMELLVRAGLTPMEAIVAATQTNAIATGFERDHGTIAVGKAADLLVLDADPSADIRNTTRIAYVVRRGRPLER